MKRRVVGAVVAVAGAAAVHAVMSRFTVRVVSGDVEALREGLRQAAEDQALALGNSGTEDVTAARQAPMEIPYYLMPHMRELHDYVGEDLPQEPAFLLWVATIDYCLWHTTKGSVLDAALPFTEYYALWERGEPAPEVARALAGFGRETDPA